jgi:hypothetical protein
LRNADLDSSLSNFPNAWRGVVVQRVCGQRRNALDGFNIWKLFECRNANKLVCVLTARYHSRFAIRCPKTPDYTYGGLAHIWIDAGHETAKSR